MRRHYFWLIVILLIAGFCIWVSLPDNPEFEQPLGLDLVGGFRVLLQAELPADAFTTDELRETANSVSRRINSLGLSEATVQLQGDTRILVEIPGESDPEQARSAIQQTALLEFVNFSGMSASQVLQFEGQRIQTTAQAELQLQRELMQAELDGESTPEPGTENTETVVVPDGLLSPVNGGQPFETVFTGAHLEAAVAEFTGTQWSIRFELDSEGAEIFGDYTLANLQQPLAIVLDGVVLSAPTIQGQLFNTGTITGRFTEDEAKQLALQLRSGSLAIPLREESVDQVGATLGQESVEKSSTRTTAAVPTPASTSSRRTTATRCATSSPTTTSTTTPTARTTRTVTTTT
jgi:preprotein translocase subunit SecD